jgi:uncharacterized protein (DUF2141 family)
MKRIALAGAAVLLFAAAAAAQLTASRGEITVIVENLRADVGQVRFMLFRSEVGFPDEPARAYKTEVVDVGNYKAQATFTDLPYGTYAVYVLHDENSNGFLDKNFFKVPTEGYGASNNAADIMEMPEYDEARVFLKSAVLTIRVEIQY